MTLDCFWPHVIALLAVIAPVALAERNPFYFVAAVMTALIGLGWSRVRRVGLISPRLALGMAVAAFAVLIHDYSTRETVLVMSLSHFIMIVCMIKLLQRRGPRDDVQVQVLCLLLLVVGGIVSGDIVFAASLVVVLIVAFSTLQRIYQHVQLAQTPQRLSIAVQPQQVTDWAGPRIGVRAYAGACLLVTAFGFGLGAVIFMLCPRVEVSRIREFSEAHAGPTLTGLGSAIQLASDTTVQQSDRAVMRVKMVTLAPVTAEDFDLHFRAYVSRQYVQRPDARGWSWQRSGSRGDELLTVDLDRDDGRAVLAYVQQPTTQVEYQFWLTPQDNGTLLCPWPSLEISSRDFSEIRLNVVDQVAQTSKPSSKVIRYSVKSVLPTEPVTLMGVGGGTPAWPDASADLGLGSAFPAPTGSTAAPKMPPVLPPDPPLPRTQEILDLIDSKIGDVGPLNVPGNRIAFLHRLQEYLSSSDFTYTLELPRRRRGREAVGEFLLESRRGHCEYFASAMAIICQLKGIPARLVSGYRGGEYNSVGGFLVVRDKNAHSWVEAWVPDRGWQQYDPTPAASRVLSDEAAWFKAGRVWWDFLQFQWANLVVAYDSASRQSVFDQFRKWVARPVRDETTLPGAVIAFVRELVGNRLELTTGDRLLYWVFALLVLALVILVAYVLAVALCRLLRGILQAHHWLNRPAARGRVEFYHRFCRRMAAYGLHPQPGQTPAEFAADLAGRWPLLRAAPQLVDAYYEVAYGGRQLSAERRAWIEDFLAQLKRARHTDSARHPVQ